MAKDIKNVFISHYGQDEEHIVKLKDLLDSKGYLVSARTSFTEISARTSLTRRCHSRLTQSMAYTEVF